MCRITPLKSFELCTVDRGLDPQGVGPDHPQEASGGLELGVPSRRLWVAAIVVSAVCVAGLAYALVVDWDTKPMRALPRATAGGNGSGFGLGLMIGIGAGIAVGSLIALRKRQ